MSQSSLKCFILNSKKSMNYELQRHTKKIKQVRKSTDTKILPTYY